MNRLQLSGAYVVVMLLGLLIFAAAAVFAIDRVQRSTLDARLETAARAAEQFVDVHDGRIELDSSDREQISDVIGADTNAAVLDGNGTVLFSSASRMHPTLRRAYGIRALFMDAGSGDAKVRAFALPIQSAGSVAGALVVWSGSDWIDETDRNLAIALGAGALIIAALALFAGNLVTTRALEDAFARQRRFTADASHELRAPLAVIRAEADLALRKEREPTQYRNALETIASESDHMETLIGDLLSAARAESGRPLVRERLDVPHLLGRVADRLASAASAKDASVRVNCTDAAVILADPQSIERALLAIGHNAIRYAPVQGTVTLHAQRIDHAVEIAVHDDGPGFSAQALRHGLERFWREPGTTPGPGSGLGLAIARSAVEANQGKIALANSPEGGAVVRLRFPAA
ncbi:MAG TPA: HAMP domain-containing sensor histidine kinase [Candidatus Baltobacteraceae bacterium]|nr:HAMP domain-containing sensor histidine kinase [Candidatus Baltobacteraceae bacterium]